MLNKYCERLKGDLVFILTNKDSCPFYVYEPPFRGLRQNPVKVFLTTLTIDTAIRLRGRVKKAVGISSTAFQFFREESFWI